MHRSARWVIAPAAKLVLLTSLAVPALAGGAGRAAPARALPATRIAQDAGDLPAFYDVPSPLPAGRPGDVIKTESVTVPDLHGTMQRVMYHSESIKGVDIAVTGLIATPSTPAPPGGYPVVSWAHGTTGIADECAPSLDPADALSFANTMLDKGWMVVGSDFEGLGTPGRHPYIVGDSEARGTIDIVRAARNLPDSEASERYVVWGHSQGGHAAMFSLHIAEDWAPELDLRGVVAGAPPSQLNLVYDFLVTSPFKYYLLMVAASINAAYGDAEAPLSEVMKPAGIEKVDLVDQGCTGFLAEQSADLDVRDLVQPQPDGTSNPFANPTWGPLIAAQDPQNFTDPAPQDLLIIHGGEDQQIPTVSSELLAGQLCPTGQALERWVYPGESHAGVIAPSFGDMVTWMDRHFADVTTQEVFVPTGAPDVEASACFDGVVQRINGPVVPPSTVPGPTPGGELPAPSPGIGGGGALPAVPVAGSPGYTG